MNIIMVISSKLKNMERVKVIVMKVPEQKPLRSWTIYGVKFDKVVEKLIKASEELSD